MATTGSIFGKNSGSIGPANIYIKPVADGDWDLDTGWQFLGPTDAIKVRDMVSKAEIKFIQEGDKAADRVIVGQQTQIETSLGKPYLERQEDIKRGLSLIRNSALAITQAMITKRVGEKDSANLFWVKVIEFVNGIESTNKLDTIYMKAASSMDTTELVFDAASQRYHGVIFEGYINDDPIVGVFDSAGRAAYLWTGIVV